MELKNIMNGLVDTALLDALKQLSVTSLWPDDDTFLPTSALMNAHTYPCTSEEWLNHCGLDRCGLNFYQYFSPEAYPQLNDHVMVTGRDTVSTVYDDAMPLVAWDDGSNRYLHADVHKMEVYQMELQSFVAGLEQRVDWLCGGSRVLFGPLTEERVVVLLDMSCLVSLHLTLLHDHLRLLLKEQLARVQVFNLLSYGSVVSVWQEEWVEPSQEMLEEAWKWMLVQSPCGTLCVLRTVMEKMLINYTGEGQVGVYLVMSSMPDQETELLCSYLEQCITGQHDVSIHVICYQPHVPSDLPVALSMGRGRYGNEKEVATAAEQLSRACEGTFHHYSHKVMRLMYS